MKESHKVVLIVVAVTLGLSWGVAKFRSGTESHASKLDFSAVAYMDAVSSEQRATEAAIDAAPALSEPRIEVAPGPATRPATRTPQQPVRAVDVRLPFQSAAACERAASAPLRTGIRFRPGSAAIRGESLIRIDAFVELWNRCGGGQVVIESLPAERVDGDARLASRRRDEVKYYLLQRAVPKADIALIDPS